MITSETAPTFSATIGSPARPASINAMGSASFSEVRRAISDALQISLASHHPGIKRFIGAFDFISSKRLPSPAIKKIIEGKESVTIWGSGKASRELLFIDDAVKAIVDAIDVNETGPFNLGTGIETSIKELVETIVEITNYKGEIIWDINKPDGQLNRYYNMDNFKNAFGYVPNTKLKDGLEKTIEWYKQNKL